MAIASTKHKYEEGVLRTPINPTYQDRQYITGDIGIFGGRIITEYRKDMISCDGYEEKRFCVRCGEDKEHENHDLIIRVDRL